ncbi:hypothetical protein I553_10286 [Mycobacterium xenopi 4042]|uniref:Uncharacterized protein n=1 Tax=Mycobacterium xenopi 4042 TaxID=1299334 RepID=X8ANI6_MYCXE|nr:hypothetical protein I553_10286 [Mycobacterium xenopi 4042]
MGATPLVVAAAVTANMTAWNRWCAAVQADGRADCTRSLI